jgi:cation/acetate symporter
VSKLATLGLGVIAIILGIIFEKQNVAFLVGLTFAIAASANFPVLVASIFWGKMTTRGALVGGFAGLISALTLTVMSKAVWGETLGHMGPDGKPVGLIFLDNPAIISIPLAFICIWLFSITDNSKQAQKDRALFPAQRVRCETGIGAEGTASH